MLKLSKRNTNKVFDAVKASDLARIQKLTKKSYFIKATTKDFDKAGYSALTHAALLGEHQIVKAMLEAHIDPNSQDKHQRTPLFVAALCDRPEVAQVLIECDNIDVNFKCTDNQTAVDAATHNSKAVLKIIGDLYGKWLVQAAKKGDLEKVRELIQLPMLNLESSDTTGWTALHFAMKDNFEDMVEVLAARGAVGTYKNMAGETALDIARKAGNFAILKLYEDTVHGQGRLKPVEREREVAPEKQVGVLVDEGVSKAKFAHKKITQEELVKLEIKAKKKHHHENLSPRDKEKEKSPRADKEKSPREPNIQVVGGWKHVDHPELLNPKLAHEDSLHLDDFNAEDL